MILPFGVFAVAVAAHYAWSVIPASTGAWVSFTPDETQTPASSYLADGEIWLGLSYGIAAAFVTFCLLRIRRDRRQAIVGAAGGTALAGFLLAAGCFLLGCCGSPMLAVYAALLGPRFMGFTGPLTFGFTVISVGLGCAWLTSRERRCCATEAVPDCCGAAATERAFPASNDSGWVTGHVTTPAGPIPRVSTTRNASDRLGMVLARLGVNRMHYAVPPGLYAVGSPTMESPVFVSANYKMSFDVLRAALAGLDGWIMVLDTRGINVWCAAGKGTFGTAEVVQRVHATELADVVSHRRLVLPQLSATGVAAHEVRKLCGFQVVYGPVRAGDIGAFVNAGMEAEPEMRQVTFTLADRIVLMPVELVMGARYVAVLSVLLFLLAGLAGRGFSMTEAGRGGGVAIALCTMALLGGGAIVPALLPVLPGKAFSLKGALVGLVIAGIYSLLHLDGPINGATCLLLASWFLILPAIAAFTAMNFTGATPYTSISGVKREMRIALPLQGAALLIGLGLFAASRLLASYGGSV
jgi:acetyl-CoA decarbonylase/synthase complex subunit gamma